MNVDGVSHSNAMASAQWLLEDGISPGAVREIFERPPVSQAEKTAAENLFQDRISDAAWVARLLGGEREAKRELILMTYLRNAPVKDAA